MNINQTTKQAPNCALCKEEKEIVAEIRFIANEMEPTLPASFCAECLEVVKTWGKIAND
jgi:hypothetical protein